jgi:hypothetical protein
MGYFSTEITVRRNSFDFDSSIEGELCASESTHGRAQLGFASY